MKNLNAKTLPALFAAVVMGASMLAVAVPAEAKGKGKAKPAATKKVSNWPSKAPKFSKNG